jgi:hypothetical protein
MSVATVSIVLAAASVIAASTYYSLMIRNQTKLRKTDLAMRLYATWDSLEFEEAFHTVYWADTTTSTRRSRASVGGATSVPTSSTSTT